MTAAPREKRTFRLSREIARQLADHARGRRQPQLVVVEAALAAFFAQDSAERLEGPMSRRLDRINKDLERLEWRLELATEALALFIRFWLTTNAPLPEAGRAAAQAMGKERWEGFVEALCRRMELGPRIGEEVARGGSKSSR
jgi:hypothetical protein